MAISGASGQFRWIPIPPGYNSTVCRGISGDATTVTGYCDDSTGTLKRRGWYWNETEGTVLIPQPAGVSPGGDPWTQMEPYSINYDGSVVVGKCGDNDISGLETAIRWNKGTNITTDLLLVLGTKGIATDVSDDGNRVTIKNSVGGSSGITPQPGSIWVGGVITNLEIPPNPAPFDPTPCQPVCVSGNGLIVGGTYDKFLGGVQTLPATIWDATTGDLIDVLPGAGLYVSSTIWDMTYDGSLAIGISGGAGRWTSGLSLWLSRTGKVITGTAPVNWFTVPLDGVYTKTPYVGTVGLFRLPLNGGSLVKLFEPTAKGNVATADNGLVYAFHMANDLGRNQVGRLSMLIRDNYL